jgi:enoyl-CoA hydratase
MASWTVEFQADVAVLTLDDGKANALLVPEFVGLQSALAQVKDSKALAVVLTGRAGYFSAGLNLKALGTMSLADKKTLVGAMGVAVLDLFLFPKPVVAAVSGHGLGGGAMLALASDVRLFAQGPYKFGLNEVQAGLFVPSYAIELARSCASAANLTPLVMHGATLSPAEALSAELAESIHEPAVLMSAALERAKALAAISGKGYSITKQLTRGPVAEVARKHMASELELLAELLG